MAEKAEDGDFVRESKSTGKFLEGIDYYYNEQGNWVFTAWYHLKRGFCCGRACINCPYGFQKKE